MTAKTVITPHRPQPDGVPIHALHPEISTCQRCRLQTNNEVHDEKRVAKYEAELAALQAEHRRRAGDNLMETR